MGTQGPQFLHGLMVQGKLLTDRADIVARYIARFREKNRRVSGFGPVGYRTEGFLHNQDGFMWSEGDSAIAEMEELVAGFFCDGETWVHQHEILLITDELSIAGNAIDLRFGAIVYLGRGTEAFLAMEGETALYLPEAAEFAFTSEFPLMEVLA